MYIIHVTYKKSLDIVDQYLVEHRLFLDEGYKKNYFIASGPKNPRTGGVIISSLEDRAQLDEIMKRDPFYINGVAEYEYVEFTPVKYHPDFACFITNKSS